MAEQRGALRFWREACLTRSLTDKHAHRFNKLCEKEFLGEGAPEDLTEYREAIVLRLRMSMNFYLQWAATSALEVRCNLVPCLLCDRITGQRPVPRPCR